MKKKIMLYIGITAVALLLAFLLNLGHSLSEDCGELPVSEQDECCAEQNVDTPHIACVGSWQYDSESGECGFVCETRKIQ